MRFIITVDNLRSVNGYTIAPRQLAIALRTRGHEALIVCGKAPVSLFPGESKQDFAELSINPRQNDQLFKNFAPDVIIGNSFVPADLLGLDYAKKNKVFCIYFVHSRIEKLLQQRMPFGEYWPDYIYKAIIDVLVNRVKNADLVIALNDEMRTYLAAMFDPARIEIISNGIDLEQFIYQDRLVDPDGQINLLYVANFEARKNQIYLLKVLANLPANYTLHLAGCSEDPAYYSKFTAALKKYRQEFPEKGKVVTHGKVDHLKIRELYDRADVFVDSSKMEAQSLVLIESIACGLPIVRLYDEHTAGVTEAGKTAVHLDHDVSPQEFAAAVKDLVGNPERYHRMCLAQKEVRSKFSREAAVDRLLEVIAKYKPTYKPAAPQHS
jgi:glycosyltransferase involved in cell wall biosynthesis